MKLLFPVWCFLLLALAILPVQADFSVDADGFTAEVIRHTPAIDNGDLGVIFIPGKGGNPQARYLNTFYRRLNKAGFEVIAPVMPWRKWDGDRQQAMAVIDKLIEFYTRKGKQTLLAGHSMGAMLSMHYATQRPSPHLRGVVAIAPGHLIHQSHLFKTATRESIERARAMLAAGKGDEVGDFIDIKQGEEYSRQTTAKIYLSYFDPRQVRSIRQILPTMQVPLLWIAGEDDRLTSSLNMADIFRHARKDGISRYIVLPGSHKGVTRRAPAVIVEWLEKF